MSEQQRLNYGRIIRMFRNARGLGLAELSKMADIGDSQLSLVENGKRNPSLAVLEQICKALDLSMLHMVMLASGEEIDPKAAVAILTSLMKERES